MKNLRKKIETFAKAHHLVIRESASWKITWMANHQGLCFCDWMNGRYCPCNQVMADLARFNGRCLCALLWLPETLKLINKSHKSHKKLTDEEKKANKLKQKESLELFNKLFRKKGSG